jgi:hypothetical protein
VDIVLNNTPSISFNAKIENTIFSNGGNLEVERFDNSFIEIDVYKKGFVTLKEYNLKTGKVKVIGNFYITILI